MADEQAVLPAVTGSESSSASAPEAPQNNSATPPAGEKPVVEQASGNQENRVPQSRFNEVVDQRNRERDMRTQYEARIRELETRPSPSENRSHIDVETDRLVSKLGLSKEAARELVETQANIARAEQGQVEQRLQQYEMNRWQENLASKYKDYRTLEPKMAEIWDQMPPQERNLVIASPRGLEMLYTYAKSQNFDGEVDKARQSGADQAYANKLAKQAVTSLPGSSSSKPGAKFSKKWLAEISNEDYKKSLPEFNAFLENGGRLE